MSQEFLLNDVKEGYNQAGNALKFSGKFGGPALSVFRLNQEYKNDIEDGNTPGEAVSHTGGLFLTGFGESGLATLAMTGSFFGPVGWVGARVAVVVDGGATLGFNALYDNNEKFRVGVDWAENKAEDMAQWTVDKIANSSVYKKIASEVTDVKQKAGEAVNQVINETVNLGKEKLNDVKKRAREALKEKIFGPKIPKLNWGWN